MGDVGKLFLGETAPQSLYGFVRGEETAFVPRHQPPSAGHHHGLGRERRARGQRRSVSGCLGGRKQELGGFPVGFFSTHLLRLLFPSPRCDLQHGAAEGLWRLPKGLSQQPCVGRASLLPWPLPFPITPGIALGTAAPQTAPSKHVSCSAPVTAAAWYAARQVLPSASLAWLLRAGRGRGDSAASLRGSGAWGRPPKLSSNWGWGSHGNGFQGAVGAGFPVMCPAGAGFFPVALCLRWRFLALTRAAARGLRFDFLCWEFGAPAPVIMGLGSAPCWV